MLYTAHINMRATIGNYFNLHGKCCVGFAAISSTARLAILAVKCACYCFNNVHLTREVSLAFALSSSTIGQRTRVEGVRDVRTLYYRGVMELFSQLSIVCEEYTILCLPLFRFAAGQLGNVYMECRPGHGMCHARLCVCAYRIDNSY